jgi:NhaP-type Na+/H+ or K+/H+ antiporter
MSPFMIKIFFAIFLLHFAVFFHLTLRRRKVYFGLLSLTFLLLVVAYGLRLWVPQAEFHEHKLFWYFRMAALAISATALLVFFRQKSKKAELQRQLKE